jgi:hypothetical protein
MTGGPTGPPLYGGRAVKHVNEGDGEARSGATAARVFVLVRDRDPSGVSGTGVVAEGAQWSDGSASLRWPGRFPSVVFWSGGVDHIQAVHGHGDATSVRFVEDLRPGAGGRGEAGDHHDVGGFCGCCGSVSPCSAMRRAASRPAGDGLR